MSRDKMREEFEEYLASEFSCIRTEWDEERKIYMAFTAQSKWKVWQASRAAMGAEVVELPEPEELAASFHEIYERLAPSFGYQTRKKTKYFDAATPNGQLMIYTCREILALLKKGG